MTCTLSGASAKRSLRERRQVGLLQTTRYQAHPGTNLDFAGSAGVYASDVIFAPPVSAGVRAFTSTRQVAAVLLGQTTSLERLMGVADRVAKD